MAKRSTAGKVVKIIVCLLLVLVLVAGIGFIVKFTNGGTESFKTFYLVHDGKTITASKSSMHFVSEEEQRFEVKYLFGKSEKTRDYFVSIVPNSDCDFKFSVDGVPYLWSDLGDISEYFDLKKEESSFTLILPMEMSVESILQAVFPDGEIVYVDETDFESSFLYKLEVTSYDGKVKFEISFSSFVDIGSFDIDRNSVVF